MARAKKATLPWGEIGAATFGAAVGGVLGMLFSPNSGKRNRQIVAKEGRKVAATATKAVRQARKEVTSVTRKAAAATTTRRKATSK